MYVYTYIYIYMGLLPLKFTTGSGGEVAKWHLTLHLLYTYSTLALHLLYTAPTRSI